MQCRITTICCNILTNHYYCRHRECKIRRQPRRILYDDGVLFRRSKTVAARTNDRDTSDDGKRLIDSTMAEQLSVFWIRVPK